MEHDIRAALKRHWDASAAGDQDTEHEIYIDDTICDYPQSGERIHGRSNLQSLRAHHPSKPRGFEVQRVFGEGNIWITEYVITYDTGPIDTVSIMEFRNNKVFHETQYFAPPFAPPAWRKHLVEVVKPSTGS